MKKRPLLIAFLGTDGSGKSTIIAALQEKFSANQIKGILIHHRSKGKSKRNNETISHQEKPPHSLILSIGKATSRFFELLYSYHFGHWNKKRKDGYLVIQDRPYFYDMVVDPIRYRYDGPTKLIWLFAKLSPQADIYITLDAPTDILIARKQEIPTERLLQQRNDYKKLASSLPNSYIVETNQSIDESVKNISKIIASHLSA